MLNTRVILVDDHSLVRAEIHKLLEKAGGIQIVGEADNGHDVLNLVEKLQPDLIILDMEMPNLKGFEIIERLQTQESSVQILAFSAYNDKQYMLKTLDYGAAGYLTKDTDPQTIIETVRQIARRQQQSEENALPVTPPATLPLTPLTDSEIEVLRLMARGKTRQQIGLSLNLTNEKVTKMIEIIFSKLNVRTPIEAAGKAIQQRLI